MRYIKGTWIQFPWQFRWSVGDGDSALLLAELCNRYALKKRAEELRGGWARLPDKYLRSRTGFTKSQLERTLSKLESLDLIDRKVEGYPARRWFRVHDKLVRKILKMVSPKTGVLSPGIPGTDSLNSREPQKGKSGSQTRIRVVRKQDSSGLENPSLENPPSPSEKEEKLYLRAMVKRGVGAWLKKRTEDCPYRRMAAQFATAHESVRKINSLSDPRRWWTDFRRLHQKSGVGIERVQEVVQWYCDQLHEYGDPNGRYIPVIWNAKTFAKKWDQLLDAMRREEVDDDVERSPIKVSRVVEEEEDFDEDEDLDDLLGAE